MSDALCGPSNAVQNLAKHSSVDRTLQQDRLVSRHSPSQGFRSHDLNAASLDPEFEAFQAGPGPAFAGPSWAGPSFPPHAPLHTASPGPSNTWTQDFQRLDISSPQQPQLQNAPQAWHNHFDQAARPSASFHTPLSQTQPQPARFYTPPAFQPMHAGLQSPHHALHVQQSQKTQQHQVPQEQFDEAAFEAAFDAAMVDAFADQDTTAQEQEPLQKSFKVDIHPHLPLFRLVLANALIVNTDESLHKAAKVIEALIQHPRGIDPVQAMLFRPLLTALNDPKRTIFAQRYGYEPALAELSEGLSGQIEKARLEIDSTTEQLLASYADLLWQRTESNHLQPVHQPHSGGNAYWLDRFYQDEEWERSENITYDSARLLTQGFGGELISNTQSQPFERVLELEYNAYSTRPGIAGLSLHPPSSSQDRVAALLNMMEHALTVPETVEALESTVGRTQEENIVQTSVPRTNQAWEDYQMQLRLLDQQNARHELMAGTKSPEMLSDTTSGLQYFDFEEVLRQEDMEEQERIRQEESDRQQDDELAQTAANLLDRVSDNQTSKFKNSAFLGLMRQLADREVRVEGDKMVSVNTTTMKVAGNDGASNTAQDGQEVVNLLNKPGNVVTDQDPEFMMTSPFASANDY